MSRTLEDIANNSYCVGLSIRTYSAQEVGAENAGCRSLFVNFEDDPEKTDNNGMIVAWIEIAIERVRDYDFIMWDKRPYEVHLKELGL